MNLRSRVLKGLLLAAGSLSLLGEPASASPQAASKGSYSFPEGDDPVLVLTSIGMKPIQLSVTLYASGTAVLENSIRDGSEEMLVTMEEREAILREIADGGLAYYDAIAIAQEQDRLGGSMVVMNSPDTDLPAFSVTLRVEHEPGDGTPSQELRHSLVIFGPKDLAKRFPSIRAFAALARLQDLFYALLSRSQIAK